MVYEKLSLCFSEALVKKTSVNKEDVKESSTRTVTADACLLMGRERNVTSPASPHLMEQKSTPGVHVHLQKAEAAHEAPQIVVNCS